MRQPPNHRQNNGLAAALWSILFLAALGIAQTLSVPALARGEIVVAHGPDSVEDIAITISVSAFTTEIRLRNNGTQGVSRKFRPATFFNRRSDNLTLPAVWTQVEPPPGLEGTAIDRLPGQQMVFMLRGDLPETGVYETSLDLIESTPAGDVEDRRIRVIVRRAAPPLPDSLLVQSDPVTLAWPGQIAGKNLFIELSNPTSERLEINPPVILAFKSVSGETTTAVVADELPELQAGTCSLASAPKLSIITPHALCALNLQLKEGLWPGRYAIDLAVSGTGDGLSEVRQVLLVRAHWWVALAVILFGTLAGYGVNQWRGAGRATVTRLIALADLRQRLRTLDSAGLANGSAVALTNLKRLEIKARAGADIASDLEQEEFRIELLAGAARMDRDVARLPADAKQFFADAWSGLLGQLEGLAPADLKAFQGKLVAFRNELDTWPTFARLVNDAAQEASLLGKLAALPAASPDAPQLREAASGLQDARRPLPADLSETLGQRSTNLASAFTAAKTLLDKALSSAGTVMEIAINAEITANPPAANHVKLKSALTALPAKLAEKIDALFAVSDRLQELSAPGAVPQGDIVAEEAALPTLSTSGFSLTVSPDLGIRLGATLEMLQNYRWWRDLLTNGFAVLAIGLGGVLTLWVPNPVWGSIGDVITALLAAATAQYIFGKQVDPDASANSSVQQ